MDIDATRTADPNQSSIAWFDSIGIDDVGRVGGKNAESNQATLDWFGSVVRVASMSMMFSLQTIPFFSSCSGIAWDGGHESSRFRGRWPADPISPAATPSV